MTIPEASILLIQCLSILYEGEIFLLDMGKPFKILDIVKRMIFFSGLTEKNKLNPSGDIVIKFTGLKKGEKLHEELFFSEKVFKSKYSSILIEKIEINNSLKMENILADMKKNLNLGNKEALEKLLIKNVY